MSDSELEQIAQEIRTFFHDREAVTAVYLFGSAAQGRMNRFSDIDVAVLYRRNQTPDLRRQLADQETLSERLNRTVDLVNLNTASPILGRQVLKNGRLLLNQDPSAVNNYFVQTLNAYFDLKRSRREIEANLYNVSIYD